MMLLRWIISAVLFVCLAGSNSRSDDRSDRVDTLFRRWNRAGAPGCMVAVVKDGAVVYRRGFGLADLEHGVPIGPHSVFEAASLTKQFTAFAILLLEQDGKLALDDDVHNYLPELHDFGKRITIRHLLQHTSGLRDHYGLLLLAGRRYEDMLTDDDALRVIFRQREWNSEPGAEFLYNNTGYALAAEIVRRVSGRPLGAFARDRILRPLRMSESHFRSDQHELVSGRVRPYVPAGQAGYRNAILSQCAVGPAGLLTTVEDLVRWDRNFEDAAVGGPAVVAKLQETGKLNDGRLTGYALGLEVGAYRGLKTVEHGGAEPGFHHTLLRFPSEHCSVIVLANAGDFDAVGMARRVADIYLSTRLAADTGEAKRWSLGNSKEVEIDPALLDAYTGEYRVFPGMLVTIHKENGRLSVQATGYPKAPLAAASQREFFVRDQEAGITFAAPAVGQCPQITVHYAGQDAPARRVQRPALGTDDLVAFAGDYYSGELGILYEVFSRDGRLWLRHPRGIEELRPMSPGVFEAPYPWSQITFIRRAAGKVSELQIDAGAVRRLRFQRVTIARAE